MTVAEELIQEGRELERRQNKTVAEELIQQGRELERRQNKTVAEELIQQGRELERRQAMVASEELIKQGRELERRQNKIKFITAMLKLNLDATAIASATELPLDEVKAIIDEINRHNTP